MEHMGGGSWSFVWLGHCELFFSESWAKSEWEVLLLWGPFLANPRPISLICFYFYFYWYKFDLILPFSSARRVGETCQKSHTLDTNKNALSSRRYQNSSTMIICSYHQLDSETKRVVHGATPISTKRNCGRKTYFLSWTQSPPNFQKRNLCQKNLFCLSCLLDWPQSSEKKVNQIMQKTR